MCFLIVQHHLGTFGHSATGTSPKTRSECKRPKWSQTRGSLLPSPASWAWHGAKYLCTVPLNPGGSRRRSRGSLANKAEAWEKMHTRPHSEVVCVPYRIVYCDLGQFRGRDYLPYLGTVQYRTERTIPTVLCLQDSVRKQC